MPHFPRAAGHTLIETLVMSLVAIVAVGMLLVLAGPSTPPAVAAESEPAVEPYFFVVGADPQLLLNQKDDRNWRMTIDFVNRLKPDFMIVCGDLVQGPNESAKWEDPENVAAYDKLVALYHGQAKRLDKSIKLYNVLGNHDVGLAPTPTTLAWYEDRFKTKPWYRFEHKNSLFVVLESNLIRDPSGAPEHGVAQDKFIADSLALAKSHDYDHRTVYMHHPMCLQSIDEDDQYFNIQKARRLDLIAQLKDAGFDAVFCGHYHRNAYVKTDDLELVTTSSCGAPMGNDPLGFRIVKVYPDRLEHEYVTFEKMPEKVELAPAR